MKEVFLVFAGGGAGSVLRYMFSKSFLHSTDNAFPWHTFTVNILGSFILGALVGYSALIHAQTENPWRFLLAVGFCGGFTTFSTFAFEGLRLLQTGQQLTFFLYVSASLVAGLAAIAAGVWLAKFFI